jgi:carboxyl-terminal processing protease
MPLSRGRAVKLTTSRYYTPSGDTIHESGVAPDIVVAGAQGYPDQNLGAIPDREGDVQLHEALEFLRNQRVVQSKVTD